MKPQSKEEIELEKSIFLDEIILNEKKEKLRWLKYKRGNYAEMETVSITSFSLLMFGQKWKLATKSFRDYFISQRCVKRLIPVKFMNMKNSGLSLGKLELRFKTTPLSLEYLCLENNIDIWEARKQWVLLKFIILSYLDNVVKFRPSSFEFKDIDEHGFPVSGHHLSDLLLKLSKVSKVWRIILKSKCIWYGPNLRQFAFLKDTFPSSFSFNKSTNIYTITNLNPPNLIRDLNDYYIMNTGI